MAQIKLGTKCSQCGYYQNNECTLGILDAFKQTGATVELTDDGHVVDRVCPYRRTPEWIVDNDLKTLINEVHVSGTLVIICKDDLNDLNIKLEKIKKLYQINKFKIVIVHFETMSRHDVLQVVTPHLEESQYLIMQVFRESFEENSQVSLKRIADESFKRAKNGYMFFVETGYPLDKNMINKVNIVINEQMKRLLYIPATDGEVHGMVCMAPLYKVIRGHKTQDIQDKIKAMATEAECDSGIMTWSEINESTSI